MKHSELAEKLFKRKEYLNKQLEDKSLEPFERKEINSKIAQVSNFIENDLQASQLRERESEYKRQLYMTKNDEERQRLTEEFQLSPEELAEQRNEELPMVKHGERLNMEQYHNLSDEEYAEKYKEMYGEYPIYRKGGGIYIKPSKRGTFTKAAKGRDMGVQEFASKVLSNKEDYSSAMVKKANFARNAAGWSKKKHGGELENELPEYRFGLSEYMPPMNQGAREFMPPAKRGLMDFFEKGDKLPDWLYEARGRAMKKYPHGGTLQSYFSPSHVSTKGPYNLNLPVDPSAITPESIKHLVRSPRNYLNQYLYDYGKQYLSSEKEKIAEQPEIEETEEFTGKELRRPQYEGYGKRFGSDMYFKYGSHLPKYQSGSPLGTIPSSYPNPPNYPWSSSGYSWSSPTPSPYSTGYPQQTYTPGYSVGSDFSQESLSKSPASFEGSEAGLGSAAGGFITGGYNILQSMKPIEHAKPAYNPAEQSVINELKQYGLNIDEAKDLMKTYQPVDASVQKMNVKQSSDQAMALTQNLSGPSRFLAQQNIKASELQNMVNIEDQRRKYEMDLNDPKKMAMGLLQAEQMRQYGISQIGALGTERARAEQFALMMDMQARAAKQKMQAEGVEQIAGGVRDLVPSYSDISSIAGAI